VALVHSWVPTILAFPSPLRRQKNDGCCRFDGSQHQIRVEVEPRSGRVNTFGVVGGRPVSAEYQGVRYQRVF
jgi:hypothetical protein